MPTPVVAQIADAVVAALNAATLSQEFTAVRTYLPVYDLKDMGTLHVTVAIRDRDEEPATRAKRKATYQIDVAVQKKIDPTDAAAGDALLYLVDQIAALFIGQRPTDYAAAICTAIEQNGPLYFPRHMREQRQFTSVLTLTFEALVT